MLTNSTQQEGPGLTIEKLNAMLRSIPRVPPPIKIQPSDYWPQDHVGHEVYSYAGHPFWQWLRRTFGIGYGVTMERGHRIMRDKDPMLYMGHTIFCSHRQAREIRARLT